MNVPYAWLNDIVSTGLPADQLAHRLTMAGLEAEKLDVIGAEWDKIYVGAVTKVEPHPDADRLVLATVDAGEHQLTVVTGAPNIAEGQKVALALAGAKLIDGYAEELKYKTLKPGTIRGVRSEGMVSSEKELGLSEEHEGILVLEPEAPVGAPLAKWLGDTVIEFEITPNLVHAFSIMGIAREAGAVTDVRPDPLPTVDMQRVPAGEGLVSVSEPELCPRYLGTIIDGIIIESSPPWMQRRLIAAGMRPINSIVDVTNYVMLEVGNPLHAFDLDFLNNGSIGVRTAHPGEKMTTLDDQERALPDNALLITSGDKPVAIAGIMGGAESEVIDTTTSIYLESASFCMKSVRTTSRELKLRTEASARFERGLDPSLVEIAAARATHLILGLNPGATVRAAQDAYPSPVSPRTITMDISRFEKLLGVHYSDDEIIDVLRRLEFSATIANGTLTVEVPTWRSDVTIPEDIIEEVARIVGYDRLPATIPDGPLPDIERDPLFNLERSVRDLLVDAGAWEGRSYITVSEEDIARWGTDVVQGPRESGTVVRLRNPLQADRPILRTSLLPALVDATIENLKHERTVRLFEIGHVYLSRGDDVLPEEPSMLGIAYAGNRYPFDWYTPTSNGENELDFFDVKGVLDLVLERNNLADVTWTPFSHPVLHPGRSAELTVGDTRLGIIGEVRPDVAVELGMDETRIVVAELDLSTLLKVRAAVEQPQITVDRFLPVEQDFAIIVDRATPAADVQTALLAGAGPLVTNVILFDTFEGEQIGEGNKSLAYRVTFTAPDRALTDAELGKVRKRIEKTLKNRVQGSLRT